MNLNLQKKYNHGKLTDNRIKEVEELLEYKLPKSYIELLKVQNGGYINKKYEKMLVNSNIWNRSK